MKGTIYYPNKNEFKEQFNNSVSGFTSFSSILSNSI